jgi:hypothetical protein
MHPFIIVSLDIRRFNELHGLDGHNLQLNTKQVADHKRRTIADGPSHAMRREDLRRLPLHGLAGRGLARVKHRGPQT